MRVNIWAFGTSPETHQRLCKKSLHYCEDLIQRRLLFPIDSTDLRKGCTAARGLRLDAEQSADVSLSRSAGGGFDAAWAIRMSGYAGPNVWQLNTR